MESNQIDIKDLSLLQQANNDDRIIMTQASNGHSASAMTVGKLKESITSGQATQEWVNAQIEAKKSDLINLDGQDPYGKAPAVKSDGTMEVGKCIDFHSSPGNRDYDVRLNCSASGNHVINLPAKTGTIALLQDKVAQANKADQLTWGRKLWGINFDGSADINGSLTGVGEIKLSQPGCFNITANGNIKGSVQSEDYSWMLQKANGGGIIIANASNGQVRIPDHLHVGNYKNTNYKLSTNSFISDDWVRTNGNTGWHSQKWGGGVHMEDNTYVRISNGKSFYCAGNGVFEGGVTFSYTSDARLKTNLKEISAAEKLLSFGKYYEFEYVQPEVERNPDMNAGTHYSAMYQTVKEVMPSMCSERADGYGIVNWLDRDYINLIASATQENTEEINRLRQENKELMQRILQLEQKLK